MNIYLLTLLTIFIQISYLLGFFIVLFSFAIDRFVEKRYVISLNFYLLMLILSPILFLLLIIVLAILHIGLGISYLLGKRYRFIKKVIIIRNEIKLKEKMHKAISYLSVSKPKTY